MTTISKIGKVRYNIRSGYQLIILRSTIHGRRFQMSTGMYCDPAQWDRRSMRPKPNYDPELNKRLNELERTYYEVIKNRPRISTSELKAILNAGIGRRAQNDGLDIHRICTFIEWVLITEKEKINVKPQSLKPLRTLKNNIDNFGLDVDFDGIDLAWLDRFIQTSYSKLHSQNTVSRAVRRISQVIDLAREKGLHQNDINRHRKFKVKNVKTRTKFRIGFDMLDELDKKTLTSQKLINTRDRFLIGCYSGLRHSDISKITRDCVEIIEGKKVIHVFTQKGEKEVFIPMVDKLDQILERCNYRIRPISSQKHNLYLKELFRLVWPDRRFVRIVNTAGNTKQERPLMSDHISSHCQRYSFATNFAELGLDLIVISQILGHSDIKTTVNYLDIDYRKMAVSFFDKLN